MATATAGAAKARRARAEAIAEQLYNEQRGRLLAIARRNSRSGEDAEEALQDAFILFIDHFKPGGEAPPLAWLTLTLKRALLGDPAEPNAKAQRRDRRAAPQRARGRRGRGPRRPRAAARGDRRGQRRGCQATAGPAS